MSPSLAIVLLLGLPCGLTLAAWAYVLAPDVSSAKRAHVPA